MLFLGIQELTSLEDKGMDHDKKVNFVHQGKDNYYRITANEIEAKGKRVAATIQINAPLLKDLRSSVRYHLMKMLSLILRL